MLHVSGCIPDSCKPARVVQQPQQSDFKMKLYYITQSPTPQLPAAEPNEAAASASVVSILTPTMNTMNHIKYYTLHTDAPHRHTDTHTETHTQKHTHRNTHTQRVQILLPELCRLHHGCTGDPRWLKMT